MKSKSYEPGSSGRIKVMNGYERWALPCDSVRSWANTSSGACLSSLQPCRQVRLAPYYCSFYKSHYRSITAGASVAVSDDGCFSAKLFAFSVYVCLSTPVRKCQFVRSNHAYIDQTNCQRGTHFCCLTLLCAPEREPTYSPDCALLVVLVAPYPAE